MYGFRIGDRVRIIGAKHPSQPRIPVHLLGLEMIYLGNVQTPWDRAKLTFIDAAHFPDPPIIEMSYLRLSNPALSPSVWGGAAWI